MVLVSWTSATSRVLDPGTKNGPWAVSSRLTVVPPRVTVVPAPVFVNAAPPVVEVVVSEVV